MQIFNKIINFNMAIYKKNQGKGLPSLQSPYKKRLIQIAKLANYEPVASIPTLNNDFNFTYAQDGHLKRKIKISQLVTTEQVIQKFESRNSAQKQKLPRIDSKHYKHERRPTNTSQQKQHLLTVDTRIQTEQLLLNSNVKSVPGQSQNSPKMGSLNARRQQIKKIRQRYKLNQINSIQSEEESQGDQYTTDATPGPGYYSVNSSTLVKNSITNSTNFSFGSRASRFQQANRTQIKISPPKKQVVQDQLKIRQIVRRRKLVPFLSCSIKNDSMITKQKVPGPQDYHPRIGIQQELIKKIQRNFKGNFGTSQQRFKSDDKYANLGPGCYNPEGQNNQEVAGSYYFISQKSRFT